MRIQNTSSPTQAIYITDHTTTKLDLRAHLGIEIEATRTPAGASGRYDITGTGALFRTFIKLSTAGSGTPSDPQGCDLTRIPRLFAPYSDTLLLIDNPQAVDQWIGECWTANTSVACILKRGGPLTIDQLILSTKCHDGVLVLGNDFTTGENPSRVNGPISIGMIRVDGNTMENDGYAVRVEPMHRTFSGDIEIGYLLNHAAHGYDEPIFKLVNYGGTFTLRGGQLAFDEMFSVDGGTESLHATIVIENVAFEVGHSPADCIDLPSSDDYVRVIWRNCTEIGGARIPDGEFLMDDDVKIAEGTEYSTPVTVPLLGADAVAAGSISAESITTEVLVAESIHSNNGVSADTNIVADGDFIAGSTSEIRWASRSALSSPADGLVLMTNAAGTGGVLLQFGGTTASFPGLRRVGADLEVVLADNSDYSYITGYGIKLWDNALSTALPLTALNGELRFNGTPLNNSYQAKDADLTALAGLTSAANKLPYFTGSATADATELSAFGRTLIDDADAESARETLDAGVIVLHSDTGPVGSPNDNSTYYPCGNIVNPTEGIAFRLYVPRSGTLESIRVTFYNGGLGTDETSTISYRVNTGSYSVISSAVKNDALATSFSSNPGVAVNAGDYITLRWQTPNPWATNPVNVGMTCDAVIAY